MTDEIIEGPDANDIRNHAKRMLTEEQYRRKYRRIDFYQPSRPQLEFHNTIATERMLKMGNQQGKTHCLAAQVAFDACGIWPDWYKGKRFDRKPAIERTFDFIAWAASTTSTMTRDNLQTKLVGDISQKDGLGTGLIPLDYFTGRPTMTRGVSNFIDTFTLRRAIGGTAAVRLKTYEMGRQAFQGEAVDEIWDDEDMGWPPNDEIYGEQLARVTTTAGNIIVSMTPVLGKTPLRRRFDEHPDTCITIRGTLDDVIHIPKSEHAAIIARTKPSEVQTRIYGADATGEGRVFTLDESVVKHARDPAKFPGYYRWLAAVDFSHGGMSASSHPFAYVCAAYDPDADIIYIMHALRLRQMLPASHVQAIKAWPAWECPVVWPHDGTQGAGLAGETYASSYKKLGLKMRPEHVTFKEGGNSLEAGIAEMEQRFASGRLLIAAHLSEVFEEYREFHRENGKIVAVDDDLLSAIRYVCMGVRFARPFGDGFGGDDGPTEYRGYDPAQPQFRRKDRRPEVAIGTDDSPLDWWK